jgi:hypothetical protein
VCCTDSFGAVYACFVCFITTRYNTWVFRHNYCFELLLATLPSAGFYRCIGMFVAEASPRGKKSITTVYC